MEFKLHPIRSGSSRDELRAYHAEVTDIALRTWLWLESRRLGRVFRSARHYTDNAVEKYSGASRVRNLLVNVKALGLRAFFARNRLRHPRERVLHALALLLWEPEVLTSPYLLHRVQTELNTHASSLAGLVAAYRALWQQVS
jgi:hypothetical protein